MVALFGQNFLGTVTGWVLGIVVGLVIAVLAYFLYYVAIVVLGASVGYAIGSGLMGAIGLNNPGFLSVIVGVVLAVILTILILALNLPKLLIMVFTAIGGAATIVSGFLLMFGQIHTAALQYGFAAAAIRAGKASFVKRLAHRNASRITPTATTSIVAVAPFASAAQTPGTSNTGRPSPCWEYQCGLAALKIRRFTWGGYGQYLTYRRARWR